MIHPADSLPFPGRLRRHQPEPVPDPVPPAEPTICRCGDRVTEPGLWVAQGRDYCSSKCARAIAGNY
jgi:hypothetical protein